MRLAWPLLGVLALAGCTGNDVEEPPVQPPAALEVCVENHSFEHDTVDVVVAVDGATVVEGEAGWPRVHFRGETSLQPGGHVLRARALGIDADTEHAFRLEPGETRRILVTFWTFNDRSFFAFNDPSEAGCREQAWTSAVSSRGDQGEMAYRRGLACTTAVEWFA